MRANRGRLATHKIEEFAAWAVSVGYIRQPTPAKIGRAHV